MLIYWGGAGGINVSITGGIWKVPLVKGDLGGSSIDFTHKRKAILALVNNPVRWDVHRSRLGDFPGGLSIAVLTYFRSIIHRHPERQYIFPWPGQFPDFWQHNPPIGIGKYR